MQPSEYEIQREVEALRDIRRRSTAGGPGSLILDPDLPSSSSQSAQTAYWSPTDDSSSSTSHEDDSDAGSSDPGDDPFHLFWVPARLHPEIAPQEFRAFLKEHARAPGDEGGMLERSASVGSSGLGRKKSMLSRQYRPSANDGVEDSEEPVVPIRRNRSSILGNPGPQLTINDLQKLEALAEEASASDDPTRLRSVLRRSLSLNVAPSALDQMDDMPDMGDDADAPIIVPRPGQILRRAARTKIRKPGQTGEGEHRFTTRSRRKSVVARSATVHEIELRTSSDLSSSDHGDVEPVASRRMGGEPQLPEVPPLPRPESYSEETLIYDAYASEEPEDMETVLEMTAPEGLSVSEFGSISPPSSTVSHSEQSESGSDVASIPPVSPVLHHPQPHRAVPSAVAAAAATPTSPSPSSDTHSPAPSVDTILQPRPSLQESTTYPGPSVTSERRDKDKDRRGLFKWGSDKGSKKNGKEREKEKEKEKEKEAGFFGSLFGGKKKQEDSPPPLGLGGSGRETAAALLGASKSSKNHAPPPSPQLNGAYARYPIHVERAIYRLSHIKLANPRRPLYEQVLISNLMFWYLGVINKTQGQGQAGAGAPAQAQNAPSAAEKEQAEREVKEREEHERAEKERLEREQAEQKDQRRGNLTKSPSAGSPNTGARRAETPVRGPQYEMQHREMEQQYGHGQGNGAGAGGTGRAVSPANGSHSGLQGTPPSRSSSSQGSLYGVQLVQPQPQAAAQRFYDGQPQQYPAVASSSPQLPPGAMPPVAVEQTWMSSTGSPSLGIPRNHSSPSPPPTATSPPNLISPSSTSPRRARSPPNNRYTPAQEKQPFSSRAPGRSLSATGTPPMPQLNGKLLKKGASAHAVVQTHHSHRKSEDEDLPLAVWQQQRRK
ncbi:hypothetical protein B0H21DRAFT_814200 [Amylocystis lapponica]|nr:hypothetical protein B0H21DRAFT_814200 [Amylocystis lapponica]